MCRFIKSFLYLFLVSANKDQPSPTSNLEIWNLKAARLVAGFSQKKKDTWLVLFQSGLYFIYFAIRQKAFEHSRFVKTEEVVDATKTTTTTFVVPHCC